MKKSLIKLFVYTICIYSGFCHIARADGCLINQIDVSGDGTNCVDAKFTVTTTSITANTQFKFYTSASGTFYVDWGDGNVDTIIRDNITSTLYNHTYTTAGVKTIRFGGLATGYGTTSVMNFHVSSSNVCNIRAIEGSLGAIFPTLGQEAEQQPRFIDTFYTCKNLTTIPESLFDGVNGGGIYMFWATFMNSGITAIPENLFSGITAAATRMFYQTFEGCSSLSGYIPPSLFAGLIKNGSPNDTSNGVMMAQVFKNTGLSTTCPAGTVQFVTGYESYWGGKVSCVDENLVCDASEYLPAHWYQCEQCLANNYCPGGIYPYSETVSQGINQCPNNLYSPMGMSAANQCGRILHVGEEVVYLRSTKKTTPALHVDIDNDGVADFFGNVTTADVPMTRGTNKKLKVSFGGQTYSVYDDSVGIEE